MSSFIHLPNSCLTTYCIPNPMLGFWDSVMRKPASVPLEADKKRGSYQKAHMWLALCWVRNRRL